MSNHTRKLPWPMSKIDRDLLHELWLEGQRTNRHITDIVAEAVITHLNRQFDIAAAATQLQQAQKTEQTAA
jgi:hypothetical protein